MICVKIGWFDRDKETGEPNHRKVHFKEFVMETPEACWSAIKKFTNNLNIMENTVPRVVDMKTV